MGLVFSNPTFYIPVVTKASQQDLAEPGLPNLTFYFLVATNASQYDFAEPGHLWTDFLSSSYGKSIWTWCCWTWHHWPDLLSDLSFLLTWTSIFQLRQTPLNMILLNLALSDLGISAIGSPMSLVAALLRGWVFGKRLCRSYAFLMSIFGEFQKLIC